MWKNLFKIKKIFNKIYKNTSSVYESIYYDIGSIVKPLVLVGANGIGGGQFGSFIDIKSEVTNNTILNITSASKDESIVNIFNVKEQENSDRPIDKVFTHNITDCDTIFVDFAYAFSEIPMRVDRRQGGYVIIYRNGVQIYNSYGVTTFGGQASFPEGSGRHRESMGEIDIGFSYCVFTKNMEFDSKSTISINFYIMRESLMSAWYYEYNINSLKATNDITRDIYATVIEQVDPTIN